MIGAIVAAVMAASFFLPWVEFFGESIAPSMIFDEGMPPLTDMPWQGLAFFASFAIAALAAVLALMGLVVRRNCWLNRGFRCAALADKLLILSGDPA